MHSADRLRNNTRGTYSMRLYTPQNIYPAAGYIVTALNKYLLLGLPFCLIFSHCLIIVLQYNCAYTVQIKMLEKT